MTTFAPSRSVHVRPRHTAALAALVCVALLPSCGSSNQYASSKPSSAASASGSASPAASSASVPAAAGLPAVDGATDLAHQPTLHAGAAPKPTKLLTRDLVVGTGPTATAQATVTVAYVGVNYDDGQVFDASWTSGQPAQFPLTGTVPGFGQGISGMKVGGRREIVIPPALGYGNQAQGPIVANETLVFVVDLKSIP